MSFVYVLRCLDRAREFYIGVTDDVERRLREHNEGRNASTKGTTWELVYYEAYRSRSYALDRERQLKKDRRVWRFVKERILKSLE